MQVITQLINASADVTVKDRIGRSVLHLAAEHGHADAISVLVTAMMAVKVDLHAQVTAQYNLHYLTRMDID